MQPPGIPDDELERLAALHARGLLDTPAEERFDRLTRITQHALSVSTVLVTLVDSDRQWFKSRQGLAVCRILDNVMRYLPPATPPERRHEPLHPR
ncbi:hypothetical protein VRRI112168_19030 [Vreelandella rituensis]